jgi:uncharacterized membrane protein YdjX (TVP38/TMEM64 family)
MSDFQALPPQKTNGMAIAGFVTALACCSPVGIILSAIGLSQIGKDPSQKGKGLATAGLIIGIISFVFSVIYYLFFFGAAVDDIYYGY